MDRALTLGAAPPARLPRPREELRLLPADANADGSPAWMIHDPVTNRFYRIGWMDFEMLVRWSLATPEAIAKSVCDETTLHADSDDVLSLGRFLEQHSLLQPTGPAAVDAMRRRAESMRRTPAEWLLHNYLFFRLPLVRPQDTLARMLPYVRWLFSRATLGVVCLASAIGLALVVHQWDTFSRSFIDHLSWEGALGYALALMFAKTLHELGHAVTATRFGVRVAHMGVAMVVLFPMLYTDTSESWKLTSPRQRLAIASAGILTELALAGIATLLWSLSPEGSFRTAMFFLASTSWVLTLLVNASPFMRFDGYFIASDLLNFPNLHERAGNLARAWLRRTVLGLAVPWPEAMPPARRRGLIAFALFTWCYRLTVFLGIATLVYLYFFKLLGLALMAVEVGWFIVRPIHTELRAWWQRRAEVGSTRKRAAAAIAILLGLGLAVPWHSGVHGAGVVHAGRQHLVFSPRAGELTSLPARRQLSQGDLLFSLAAPELRSNQHRSQVLADARALELVGLSGLPDGEERRALLQAERDRLLAEAGVFSGEQSRMNLVAPFKGELVDIDPQLRAGVWVQPRQPLALLVDPTSWVAEVYVAEDDVARIHPGDSVSIVIGAREPRVAQGRVLEIDTARTATLPYAMLDAASGGPIVTLPPRAEDRGQERVVRDGLFRVRIDLQGRPAREQMTLCTAVISGERSSLLAGVLETAISVIVRESGF
ncbi:MAG TPA: HlyD family efflux transporter periplasmic adaptor subunit [Ramlibacter sp.]|uniref:HlyD family efflux transporter periplasmic adaptor subunit n=1 Tax=Ramlibacter sp. TaxID=1917967 RepID=UPI002CD83729|nr:HlyD family efflux transporter periplasmic adaptor subunit [Ramlibacter sp.]HVZ43516.1 HlyD family efflux transporter periplasmic adaptor subunit [Ramlibacter sp.]